MNLKVHLVDICFTNSAWAVFRYPVLTLDLKASADSNIFKLFGSSSHILGPKYAKEFNPKCTVFIGVTADFYWFLKL